MLAEPLALGVGSRVFELSVEAGLQGLGGHHVPMTGLVGSAAFDPGRDGVLSLEDDERAEQAGGAKADQPSDGQVAPPGALGHLTKPAREAGGAKLPYHLRVASLARPIPHVFDSSTPNRSERLPTWRERAGV